MFAKLLAFVIWAAVAGSAVFWLLRLTVKPAPPPQNTVPVDFAAQGSGDWSRLLGREPLVVNADEVQAEAVDNVAASRFRLVGVVAPHSSGRSGGIALIAVDNGPVKAYRVGGVVDGTTTLQSVHGFGVSLGPRDGVPSVTLELPALPPPATGTLPPPGSAPVPTSVGTVPSFPAARTPVVPMTRPTIVRPPVTSPPPVEATGGIVEQDGSTPVE